MMGRWRVFCPIPDKIIQGRFRAERSILLIFFWMNRTSYRPRAVFGFRTRRTGFAHRASMCPDGPFAGGALFVGMAAAFGVTRLMSRFLLRPAHRSGVIFAGPVAVLPAGAAGSLGSSPPCRRCRPHDCPAQRVTAGLAQGCRIAAMASRAAGDITLDSRACHRLATRAL